MRILTLIPVDLLVSACAVPTPAPLALPQGVPLQIQYPPGPANLQVFMTQIATRGLVAEAIDSTNKDNTAFLSEAAGQQAKESAARLFRDELGKQLAARGVRLAAAGTPGAAVLTLENLSVVYMAATAVNSYRPVAFVYLSSSTDPPGTGNKPGAVVRSIESRDASPEFSFPTSDALRSDPARAISGLRAATVQLAARVAQEIAVAQGLTGRRDDA